MSFTIILFDISGAPRDLNAYTATSGTVGSSRRCALSWPTHNTSLNVLSDVLLALTAAVIVDEFLLAAAPCTAFTIVSSFSSELASSPEGLLC